MSARMLLVSAAAGMLALVCLPAHLVSALTRPARGTPDHATRAAVPSQPITGRQATDIVLRRPELGALADRTEKASGGKVHMAIMLEDDKPTVIDGQGYWGVGVYESHADHMPRLGYLLVRVQDGQIFAQDLVTERITPFADWSRSMNLPTSVKPPAKAVAKKAATKHLAKHRKHIAKRPAAKRPIAKARPRPVNPGPTYLRRIA